MKQLLTLILICGIALGAKATTYYSFGSGSATVTGSWWTGTSGTGSNPANFTTPGDVFIVQSALTIASSWTIGTAGTYTSQLQFNSGSLSGSASVVITIYGNFVMTGGFYTNPSTGSGTFNVWGNLQLSGTSYMTNPPSYNYIHMCNTGSSLASPQLMSCTSTGAWTYTYLYVDAGCTAQLNGNLNTSAFPSGTSISGTIVFPTGFVVNGTGTYIVNSGANCYVQTAASPWTGTGTPSLSGSANYYYNGTVAQTIGNSLPTGMASGGSVVINNSAGVTLSSATTFASGTNINLVNGAFLHPSAAITMSAGSGINVDNGTFGTAPTFSGAVNVNYVNLSVNSLSVTTGFELANTTTGLGAITINKPGATITVATGATLTLNGALNLAAGTLALGAVSPNLKSNITGTGIETATTGALTMTTASSTISGATLANLTLNNATGFSLSGSPTITGTLAFTAGKLTLGSNTLNLAGSVSGMSTTNVLTANGLSNISMGGIGSSFTLFFDQTTVGTTNKVATFSQGTSGVTTLGNALVVATQLALNSGTVNDGGNVITVAGNVTGSATESGTGGINMTTNGATVSGATINKLTVNNNITLSGSPTITGALALNSGILTTGANSISLLSGATITRTASTTSNYVFGNLKKTVTGLSAVNFEVGDADFLADGANDGHGATP